MNSFTDANLSVSKPTPKRHSFLRHTTALFLILAGGLAMVLFSVKYQVHDLEAEHQRLILQLDEERRSLHVLRAEWANLNDPQRLKTLAEDYLGMQPMEPHQVMSVQDVQSLPKPISLSVEDGEMMLETQ